MLRSFPEPFLDLKQILQCLEIPPIPGSGVESEIKPQNFGLLWDRNIETSLKTSSFACYLCHH